MISVVTLLSMMLEVITIDPSLRFGASIIALAIAVILHEVSHGFVAFRLGDPTAFYAGRLTLNPFKHIDLVGTIVVPLLLFLSKTGIVFGWAKPVPVNYYNLKYGKYGPVIVALAGPVTNFILALIFAILARISPAGTALPFLFITISFINSFLMLFNLIPIPPLDGSKVLYLFLDRRPDIIQWLERYSFYILIGVLFLGSSLITSLVTIPAFQITSVFSGFSLSEIVQIIGG